MNRAVNLSFLSSIALLAAVSTGAQASPGCDAFNTAAFFATATPEDVAECLDQGADLLPDTAPEDSPLFHAVRNATTPLVLDVLLDEALERDQLEDVLHQPGRLGRSITHIAAAEARGPAMITWLATREADIRATYDCNDAWRPSCTEPIHIAAHRSDGFLFVATLLALGADGTVSTRFGLTPAEMPRTESPSHWSIHALLDREDWPEKTLGLNDAEPDPNAACDSFLTPDFFASATLGEVAFCLEQGAVATATDREGNTALHHAAAHAADPRIIDLLLLRLHMQAPESVANALQRANQTGFSPLHHAARHGTGPEAIARLIAWGADPNALAPPIAEPRFSADRGTTPLHLAARNTSRAREAILTVLLAMGASPTVQDHRGEGRGGRQALHYLMQSRPNVRETRLMLHKEFAGRRRPSPLSDDARATALHFATHANVEHGVISALVRQGFSPDDRDSNQMTPLMNGARFATDETVFGLLLQESRDPCWVNEAGLSIPALLAGNPVLSRDDPTGRTQTPLAAYRARCPA
ncbi:ankyrin repeat domain-containing protein [Rhodobacteraceae bacterium 2376]|uniref:Ankyrin repeat domain-containing protein n=1 Tax=Rhabdonatronobacter sediminivivens TaxID=2743469 RepID=A0A7Z0I2H1_9RHOB|nr:ankyrin repeat domain-containing protein [Rhabdonatronobacter sediminivivens]NYS26728.1 ankyrin repeat domain-containing protein [Rhabdonatronobacter sediminivivens]